MRDQHAWLAQAGFQSVETGTRADNQAMIAVNLSCGFEIVGSRRKGADVEKILSRSIPG